VSQCLLQSDRTACSSVTLGCRVPLDTSPQSTAVIFSRHARSHKQKLTSPGSAKPQSRWTKSEGGTAHMIKRQITSLTSSRRASTPIMLALLIWVCQVAARPETSDRANPRSYQQPPLRYRVVAVQPEICEGKDLDLELELENTSNHTLATDPKALSYQVSITGEGQGSSSVADPLRKPSASQLVTLPPGKSYRTTVRYPLKEARFPLGIYRIRFTYGQFADESPTLPNLFRGTIDSNVVLFHIIDCERDELPKG